jgi:hypothetical protein
MRIVASPALMHCTPRGQRESETTFERELEAFARRTPPIARF